MALELGDVQSGAETETQSSNDGSAAVGDAIALDTDTQNWDQAINNDGSRAIPHGVELGAISSNNANSTLLSGRVVANVVSNVLEGQELNSSGTAGRFGNVSSASETGVATALSDEGGTYQGESVPSNAAVIYFRGG